MNQTLYQKIKQTIEQKDCLFQIDEDKKASIAHNISAYVTEMLERECEIIRIEKHYDWLDFFTYSPTYFFKRFIDDWSEQSKGRNEQTYYNQHKEYWSNLLNDELNK